MHLWFSPSYICFIYRLINKFKGLISYSSRDMTLF